MNIAPRCTPPAKSAGRRHLHARHSPQAGFARGPRHGSMAREAASQRLWCDACASRRSRNANDRRAGFLSLAQRLGARRPTARSISNSERRRPPADAHRYAPQEKFVNERRREPSS
jgi:hypothetical protein